MKIFFQVVTTALLWTCTPNSIQAGQTLFTEAKDMTIQQRLQLKNDARLFNQFITSGGGDDDAFVFTTKGGREYHVDRSKFFPVQSIFSPEDFDYLADGTVRNKETGEITNVVVSSATVEDGTEIQLTKDADGTVLCVEVLEPEGGVTYLVRADQSTMGLDNDGSFVTFAEDEFADDFGYNDGIQIPDVVNTHHNVRRRTSPKSTNAPVHRRMFDATRGLAVNCKGVYKMVKAAVAFDEEFCELYGSKKYAKNRIQLIFSMAKARYKSDMCVDLVLSPIIEPRTCNTNSNNHSPFKKLNRNNACTPEPSGEHFLYGFTKYMRGNRGSLSNDVAVMLFSGYPHPGAELGCAWTGTYCDVKWAYGINYMGNKANPAAEAVIYMHEIGHTLGMSHVQVPGKNFIMTAWVTSGSHGFSASSRQKMLDYLSKQTCDIDVKTLGVLAHQPIEITATVMLPEHPNQVYFFFTQNGTALYSRYDMDQGAVAEGFPEPVADFDTNWPFMDWSPTRGFISANENDLYFIKGGTPTTVLRLPLDGSQPDGPAPMDLPLMDPNVNYRGAMMWPNGELYLFAGDEYYMFDTNRNKEGDGYPKRIDSYWKNWPTGFQPTSGFVAPQGIGPRYAYIFGVMPNDPTPVYIRYNMVSKEVEANFPRLVADDWAGLV